MTHLQNGQRLIWCWQAGCRGDDENKLKRKSGNFFLSSKIKTIFFCFDSRLAKTVQSRSGRRGVNKLEMKKKLVCAFVLALSLLQRSNASAVFDIEVDNDIEYLFDTDIDTRPSLKDVEMAALFRKEFEVKYRFVSFCTYRQFSNTLTNFPFLFTCSYIHTFILQKYECFVCMCVHMYVHKYVRMYACMYVYI
jgi:hypothetical protein